MKCIIYSPPVHTAWLQDYFSAINPFYLKILNKPLLEYYIDFCALTGIREIRVINNEPGMELEDYFGEGRQWGVELSYGFAKPEDGLAQVIKKNRSFCEEEDLLIIYGYQFIRFSKSQSEYDLMQQQESASVRSGDYALYYISPATELKSLDFAEIKSYDVHSPQILPLQSIKTYYQLNLEILQEGRADYFLPGYNNEDGVFLGKNVIDKKSTNYQKPLLLGDNVQIQMGTDIGPNVILGDNVIIDYSTSISDSIIYENSYIGSELEIKNKIVYRKRLIDPVNEEVMQIVDSFLVSDIQNNLFRTSLSRIVNIFFSLILIVLTTIPYLLLLFPCLLKGMKIKAVPLYKDSESNTMQGYEFDLPGYWFFKRLFIRFSLDLYPLYYKVISGDLHLVGNHPLKRSRNTVKLLHTLPSYRPGVYSYSGSMLHNEHHENFLNDELEYCHTRSIWFDFRILIQSWIARLFSEWSNLCDYLGEKSGSCR